jgi:hypothetical protein
MGVSLGAWGYSIGGIARKYQILEPTMPLTGTAVKKAKPSNKPAKLSDGKGMYLLVNPGGSKLWRWKYRVLGKEKVMSLGAYPDVSLAQAREGVDKARKVLAAGDDPMAIRKADKAATRSAAENSFETVARMWWAHWKPTRSEQHAGQVMRRFEANVFPHIGSRPVSEIQAPELVAMLKAIEGRGVNDLAKRALQTSSQVFRYAIAHGLATCRPSSTASMAWSSAGPLARTPTLNSSTRCWMQPSRRWPAAMSGPSSTLIVEHTIAGPVGYRGSVTRS